MLRRIPIFWKLSAAYLLVIFFIIVMHLVFDKLALFNSNIILRAFFEIFIAIVLTCITAWFFVKRFVKKPVLKLVDRMNELVGKEAYFHLDDEQKDEFSSLVSSFNDLASMLAASQLELQKNKDYLEGILENTADIIITVNLAGKIQTINSGAEKALGYKRSDIIGKPIEMLFANPRDRELALDRLKNGNNVANFETRFLTKDGQIRDVLLTLSELRNPSGEVIGTFGISKDVTREKRLQDQLIQSQRYAAIGQVFTGLQHSLKNMLNACMGGAYMVRLGLAKDKRSLFEEGWNIVQDGISRLTDMSLDMLKYVREWKPKFELVDLSKTLFEIDRLISQTAKEKGIEFRLNIASDLPGILCDARMIHTAVMDIVSNALDACYWKEYDEEEVPEVILGAYLNHDRKMFIIEIKDNGCGMTEEVKKNIFTPFFSTKSKTGTGLGLAITSRLIEAHNGQFVVESEPNKGTVFRIVLPHNKTT